MNHGFGSRLVTLVACSLLGSCDGSATGAATETDAAAQAAAQPTGSADLTDETRTDACPRPVHPDYCRRACRSFVARIETLHAKRMRFPTQAGLGTCGEYFVFAEREIADHGGDGRSLTEYYDRTSTLVGSVDPRREPCERFGVAPECAPRIHWFRPGELVRDPHAEIEQLRKERDENAAR